MISSTTIYGLLLQSDNLLQMINPGVRTCSRELRDAADEVGTIEDRSVVIDVLRYDPDLRVDLLLYKCRPANQ